MNELEQIINNSINISAYEPSIKDPIFIQFIVNCKGEDVEYKSVRTINSDLESDLINLIRSELSWTAGQQRGITVDVIKYLIIRVEKGRLKISE